MKEKSKKLNYNFQLPYQEGKVDRKEFPQKNAE
jgi:hypothetical protein